MTGMHDIRGKTWHACIRGHAHAQLVSHRNACIRLHTCHTTFLVSSKRWCEKSESSSFCVGATSASSTACIRSGTCSQKRGTRGRCVGTVVLWRRARNDEESSCRRRTTTGDSPWCFDEFATSLLAARDKPRPRHSRLLFVRSAFLSIARNS